MAGEIVDYNYLKREIDLRVEHEGWRGKPRLFELDEGKAFAVTVNAPYRVMPIEHFGIHVGLLAPRITGSVGSLANLLDISATFDEANRSFSIWNCRAFHYDPQDYCYYVLEWDTQGGNPRRLPFTSANRVNEMMADDWSEAVPLEEVRAMVLPGYPEVVDGMGTMLRYVLNTTDPVGYEELTARDIEEHLLLPG